MKDAVPICRLDDVPDGEVRGFISCPTSAGEPNNVFANTTAPIGLGAYALPEKK